EHVRFAHDSRKPLREQLQQTISGRVTVQVVDFLEEIHVDHDEDQVAMIQSSDVGSSRPLIIPQYLLCLGRQDFLQVAPVPDSCQSVGKRNLLQFEILSLQFQAVPAQ